MKERIERLQSKLEEPLLVTTPANVTYLTGFVSSNASLFVEPDAVRLFTDFRYAEAARKVADVEFVEARRDTVRHGAELLSGTIGLESTHLSYRHWLVVLDGGLQGQLAGLAAARAGADGVEVDKASRDVIDEAGFGDKFRHGLGHGVGIDVHEAPRLAQTSTDTLAVRNVVTIEPGIYLEGTGGIRIEDLVVVTDGEPEVLSSFPKELVTVG